MTEFMFGLTFKKPSDKTIKHWDKMAKMLGGNRAGFCWCDMPDKPRGWFYAPNKGQPFNRMLMHDVYIAVGIIPCDDKPEIPTDREPTMQELDAGFLHDVLCPDADACTRRVKTKK